MIIRGAQCLEENKQEVDSLNVFPVPDGDTGTNMSLTMNSAKKEVQELSDDTVEKISQGLANGLLMGARGNSGVILSQIFRGFAKGCEGKEKLGILDFSQALKNAADTAYKAVMKPIEGTILTIAREIGEKAVELSKEQMYMDDFIKKLIEHAEKILDKTPDMLKVLKEAGVVDAGGKGLIFVFYGFYEALTGKEIISEPIDYNIHKNVNVNIENTDIEFGYCTEFMIKGKDINIEKFKRTIVNYGDSMLVVGTADLVKVHIHTNHPGQVLEHGIKVGQLVDIKVDNMRVQHQNKMLEGDLLQGENEMKEYGIITVTMGDGLSNIFKDLNVDEVITGGQTMNPSTQDIKDAIDKIKAKNIFILPNNSNIILAANQAKELSDKNIIVIPTKTAPEGISAALAYNKELGVDENIENMTEAIKSVKTGQITYSVRNTQFNEMEIKEGDILGISDGNIVNVGKEIEKEAYDTIEKIVDEDDAVITIFYGEEITKEQADDLAEKLSDKYEDMDVEVYYGGQPLYYYIFSVE
ncbi:DAK2 domain-containing protein [Lutibacter sp. B2]|nr:DAK2 domain-containing protein [Lutibacter sp. B2]